MGKWNCQVMQTQLSWPFLFLWNRPGKKQEGTRKIFIESTNAPFLHAMETLYVPVSEERREKALQSYCKPQHLSSGVSGFVEEPAHWGSPKRQTGTGWVSGASEVVKMDWKSLLPPSQCRFCSLLCPRVSVLCPANTHLAGPDTAQVTQLLLGFLLPGIFEDSEWHILWKKS